MPLEGRLITGLALALGLVYWTTPLAIRLAERLEFYDRPVGYKGHATPTPYLGGLAVVGGYVLVLLLLTADWSRTIPLLGGIVVLWLAGTVDDRRNVTPHLRVLIEVTLAAGLFSLGLGWDLGAGPAVDLVVTAVWVVAVVNAFNLFDNMDGAATSMAGIVAGGLAVLGVIQADAWLAVAAASLSGACLGFLPHNLLSSPARIFLGDGGSMPIGFAVAALTMIGLSGSAAEWQSLAMGVLFVGVPALDTALVVISRRRRGISILTGGRDHLTHRARQRLHTARAVAVALGAAQVFVSALALVAIRGGSSGVLIAVAAYVIAVATAITVLDARYDHAAVPVDRPSADRGSRGPGRWEVLAPALLVPIAAIAGMSPFAFGYYDSEQWVAGGLILTLLVTAGAIARPVRLSRPAWTALGGLTGLALVSLASGLWADSIQQAVTEGNRLLVYAVLSGGLCLLIRSDRSALILLGMFSLVGLLVAASVLVRMLGPQGQTLFLAGRLDEPLGYINGQASFFLIALWPCLAAAEQRRSAFLAGAGMAGATTFACLLVLSQSRGVAIAAVVTALIVLAVAPGRLRRAWAYVVIAGSVALAGALLFDVFRSGAAPDVVRRAALAILAVAAGAGILWAAAVASTATAASRTTARQIATIGLAIVCLTVAGAGIVHAGRITDTVSTQYRAFVFKPVEPQGSAVDAAGRSRLLSGAGNRYDYWRVAWGSFRDDPLLGVGAGNFDAEWFAARAATEDVRQPHSIELQTLGELGLLGFGLLLTFLGGVAWGAWRTARAAATSQEAAAVAVAGTGMAAAWLVHTSVDWIHLLPGLTAAALAAMIALVRRPSPTPGRPAVRTTRTRALSVAAAAGVALVLATAGLSLVRQALSEHYRNAAQASLPEDAVNAILQADRALRLDPELVPAYYAKAAAFARIGDAAASRDTLAEAARREPRDFVTWALLGDLALRVGDREAALRNYGIAVKLNPRDAGLQEQIQLLSSRAP